MNVRVNDKKICSGFNRIRLFASIKTCILTPENMKLLNIMLTPSIRPLRRQTNGGLLVR
jgi:hypothetical protein